MAKIDTNKQESLSHTLLINHLHYAPDTGLFTYRYNYYKVKEGDVAGCLNNHGYRRIQIDRITYVAHRLAWFYTYKEWPKEEIDHINGIRDDNRLANLRTVSSSENRRNQTINSKNTSGHVGVYYNNRDNYWCAQIRIKDNTHHLGCFATRVQAVQAREYAEKYHNFHPNHGKQKQ